LSVEAVLQLTTQILADLEIPYMVTGSLASAFYGEPRSTQDVDVVVSAPEERLQALGARLRAYFGASGGTVSVEVEGAFRSKWRDHFGDVALPFRHMWRGPEPRSESDAG
jgi:hypothetical protein